MLPSVRTFCRRRTVRASGTIIGGWTTSGRIWISSRRCRGMSKESDGLVKPSRMSCALVRKWESQAEACGYRKESRRKGALFTSLSWTELRRRRIQLQVSVAMTHAQFPVQRNRKRVRSFQVQAGSHLPPQPPETGIPRIQMMPVRFAVDGADGLMKRRHKCQFLLQPPEQTLVHPGGIHAVDESVQVVGAIVEEPRAAVNIHAAVAIE